jgi:hypothetical protein
MSRRSRQLAALLTVLLLVAVFAWGCGSGGGESTTTTGGDGAATTLPPVATSTPGNTLVGTQLKTTDSTPREYVDAIAQGHPVVILFYVSAGADDAKVLDSISSLQPSFPNYVFLLYDHQLPDSYGDLSTLLKVSYPPELIYLDSTGTIKEIWNGYVDRGTINQSLVNLGGQ